ncbi:tetratricopeptide repeat protein [Marinoscillum sp. MHG1-6]|uniref:tetratricopeptide repeat protein n=1 Tax=Marinoscillum sp. MHG1-6 TaxID=2959627 RepID=UPI0021585A99|nr:tetratricopeptide repeat protein [Marinoscillum sp. MHG1-6]
MNKLKFVEFIRKPSELSQKNLDELEEVVKEFPYFQNARIILAKGSKLKDSADAAKNIASASVYSTNRALLKKYINDQLIFLRSLEAEESSPGTRKQKVEVAPEKAAKPKMGEDDFHQKSAQVAKTKTASTDRPSEAKPTPAQRPVPSAPIKQQQVEHTELDDLIDALWKDVEELRKSKARFLEIEKKIEEDEAVDEALKKAAKKSTTSKTTKPTKSTSSTKTKTEGTSKASTTKTKKTATTTKKPAAKKTTTTKKTTTKKSSGTAEKKEDKSGGGSSKKDDKGDRKAQQQDIIDNFIKVNPTMPPMSKEMDIKPGDLSGDSTEFPVDVASEYLAEIYLQQGRKERAIQIYEVLITKYPEKSAYFADVIKKLKEQS